MKMTLPFKPHVLALICSAGLCAASTGLYIKSRTVEAPVEPQSTQLAVSDAAAVTLPATVSAPPVTPAVVKSAFSTAQIDQWVAPVALYPDSLLSQVLMASTYPANVAQAVQWSHDNPLKQGDAAIQAVSDQPWDASVKSLVAFPQLMALMGENPQWVQNLGDAFLAQPQDVMDSVQRLRQLAQQTGSLKSLTEQKVITTTKKAVPVKQTVTAPVIPSNTVSTATPVITEPANRVNIVLTHDMQYKVKGAVVCHSLEEALKALKDYDEGDIYIIGGESVYRQFLPYCTTAHVTSIDYTYDGDSYFPDLEEEEGWYLAEEGDEQTYFDLCYTFRRFRRKK